MSDRLTRKCLWWYRAVYHLHIGGKNRASNDVMKRPTELVNTETSGGPSTDPCVTPEVDGVLGERQLLMASCC